MASKNLVESFYSETIQSNMTTSSVEVNVDIAPANPISYGILENGEANQEMFKWTAKAGLTLSGLLRGLSLTALTDTEVAGNKKTHIINDSIEITDAHYLLNDKVSNAAEETISGQKTHTLAIIQSVAAAAANELIRYGETVRLVDNQTVNGVKSFGSIPIGPNADPTVANEFTRKSYVDALIAALDVPNIIDAHAVYTPAFLTGGNLAETNPAIWDSVSDGAFQFTLDGVARSLTALDFTSIVDMDDVAEVIQTGIRALTGLLETCIFDTDHFVITSADVTSTSAITVLTAGASGTDISGVGTVYMDSETGRGVVTAKVLDPTQDAGKLVKMGSDGNIEQEFLVNAGTPGMIHIYAGATAPTGWLLCDGTTGLNSVTDTTLAALFAIIGTTFGGAGAADFDLPDMRGNFPLGKDNMGGASRDRVTDAAADSIGGEGGEQTHTLIISEMPAHTHSLERLGGSGSKVFLTSPASVVTDDATTGSSGGDGAHENMSPYMTFNYIIKK